MTNEEIIEMVREAGGYSPEKYPDEWRLDVDDLLRFAKLVAEKERDKFLSALRAFHDSISLASNSNRTGDKDEA